MNENIILVDENDTEIGTMPKLLAHQLGKLHRAFSVFIFNNKGELLIQQRAAHKYHSAGQWANSCCSHPRPNETTLNAAKRRLIEELGFSTAISPAGHLIYHSDVSGGLIEHEYDHLFVGHYNQEVSPNPDEVAATRWVTISQLRNEIESTPEQFTPWLKMILEQLSKGNLIEELSYLK
ncbi:isopentenyl-diphosphate Delta-isomerase [Providencia burhodogranariea]|uniref:Isopentenyl-diphosphate Delta-isomerase n=1 Tax=Providencia burhodogranariea DSM 19968 TaxID=1141662 RepID=K8WD11_9GAMM|nr:isopentenyl-diphosphate Delta-isomerase [Providencia burhodogranariea]EKT55342.1 isopentenyl-diphosphate delta-isomerase [Providencia burhodogranariea DSM 19968]